MKKTAVSIVTLLLLTLAVGAFATDVENQAPKAATPQPAAELTPIPTDAPESVPTPAEVPAAEVPTPVDPEAQVIENLEFKSGEVTTVDEAAKSVTMKLYGETETAGNEQILTVKVNESTDITDGEKDRDLKSLTAGTEVDVEYDPVNSLATYIFVY